MTKPTAHVEMDNAAVDITCRAELLVVDCLKNWNCIQTLEAFTEKQSASREWPLAAKRFVEDLNSKVVATDSGGTILEHLIRSTSNHPAAKDSKIKSNPEWTKEETSQLRKAIRKTNSVHDKSERWKQIADLVGNGKTKKNCYVKYKELKEQQTNQAVRPTTLRTSSSSKGDYERIDSDNFKSITKLAEDSQSEVLDDDKPKDDQISQAKLSAPQLSDNATTAFLVSRRENPATENGSTETLEIEDFEDITMPFKQPITGRAQLGWPTSIAAIPFANSSSRIPTESEVAAVQKLLFGVNNKTFSPSWREQGFVFSSVCDLHYGLVQHQGGPCGILAVVQGYVLRFLLQHAPTDWKNVDAPNKERALVKALTHILWQCAQNSHCVIAVKRADGGGQRRFMAGFRLHIANTKDQTEQIVTAHLPQWMESKGSGLEQFVLSVLFTKGIENIKSEMDQLMGDSGGQLIGAHDYCTQDIVNLLLCGYASSNVFNGDQVLNGTSSSDPNAIVLRGISSQSVVGFLSLFEAYEHLIVGSNLKDPHVNIWVVCSESHYSVLFVADPLELENRHIDTASSFDLLYYDGLANQDEEIRLTVSTLEQQTVASHDHDLMPPLDLVIRTKWPHVAINWNNVDPLL